MGASNKIPMVDSMLRTPSWLDFGRFGAELGGGAVTIGCWLGEGY